MLLASASSLIDNRFCFFVNSRNMLRTTLSVHTLSVAFEPLQNHDTKSSAALVLGVAILGSSHSDTSLGCPAYKVSHLRLDFFRRVPASHRTSPPECAVATILQSAKQPYLYSSDISSTQYYIFSTYSYIYSAQSSITSFNHK